MSPRKLILSTSLALFASVVSAQDQRPGVIGSPGGNPIMVGGKVTGAVGVSGVTGDQDEQCAKAGISGM